MTYTTEYKTEAGSLHRAEITFHPDPKNDLDASTVYLLGNMLPRLDEDQVRDIEIRDRGHLFSKAFRIYSENDAPLKITFFFPSLR